MREVWLGSSTSLPKLTGLPTESATSDHVSAQGLLREWARAQSSGECDDDIGPGRLAYNSKQALGRQCVPSTNACLTQAEYYPLKGNRQALIK